MKKEAKEVGLAETPRSLEMCTAARSVSLWVSVCGRWRGTAP